ncbi:hypothetical protein [Roseovarius sp. MMSF_3281]|uniref:hypothetical protein n=1 Tax=Roseovarius sp. MMSF_3281 TaxID=3046694 RepID=UPI00273DB1BE|nr:hypothetical protein [Roseovarius sp. MMSF_3281]
MSNTASFSPCRIVCWGLAALIGLVLLLSIWDGVGFIAAFMAAAALAVFIGLVATRLFCSGGKASVEGTAESASETGSAGGMASAVAEKASGAASATADAARSAASSAGDMAKDVADKGKDAVAAVKDKATDAGESAKDAAQDAVAGGKDLADEAKAAAEDAGDKVTSGTLLQGEEELANRKGEWAYNKGGAETATPDYDADGVREGSDEGTRPEALSGPRDGQADDLKQIKGVGPKLEKLCNEKGFYHFDQIAGWGPDEVAWVDANLKGFKGRVSRDNWVEQAKILASGGETEFSKRVEGGSVY